MASLEKFVVDCATLKGIEYSFYEVVKKMVKEKERCKGRFLGLVIDGENKRYDIYSSIQSGECKIVKYIENSNMPELILLEETVGMAFIEGLNCYRIISSYDEK